METLVRPTPPRPATRRGRRICPVVEGLEIREVSTSLLSPTATVLLNPRPMPPLASPASVSYLPGHRADYPPNPC